MIRYRGRDIERYNGKNEATSSRPISFSLYATRASCSSMGKESLKSFESRLTIFLSYSFIQRARTRARSF